MNPQISIKLKPLESFVLAQFIRYLVRDEQSPHVSRSFLMDFAVALLHHTNEAGVVFVDELAEEVPVTEDDILNLRELVPADVTMGSMPVGLTIHRKLYEALLRYHPEQAAELWFGEAEEPSLEAFALEVERLKRREGR